MIPSFIQARPPHLPVLGITMLSSSICSGLPGSLLAGSRGKQAVQPLLLPLKPSSSLLVEPFGAALVKVWRRGHSLWQQHQRQLRHSDVIKRFTGCRYTGVALSDTCNAKTKWIFWLQIQRWGSLRLLQRGVREEPDKHGVGRHDLAKRYGQCLVAATVILRQVLF